MASGVQQEMVDRVNNDDFHARMIQMHYEMLEQKMTASDILRYLTCISRQDYIHILQISQTDPQKANKFLLDKILKTKGDGWFQSFIDALNKAGFDQLALKVQLNYKSVPDETHWEKIRIHFPELLNINAKELSVELFSKQVISEPVLDRINSRSGQEAAVELLLRLPNKKEDWFCQFLVALKKCKSNNTLEALDCSSLVRLDTDLSVKVMEVAMREVKHVENQKVVLYYRENDGHGGAVGGEYNNYHESPAPSRNLNGANDEKKYNRDADIDKIKSSSEKGAKAVGKAARFPQSPSAARKSIVADETIPKEIGAASQPRATNESEASPERTGVRSQPRAANERAARHRNTTGTTENQTRVPVGSAIESRLKERAPTTRSEFRSSSTVRELPSTADQRVDPAPCSSEEPKFMNWSNKKVEPASEQESIFDLRADDDVATDGSQPPARKFIHGVEINQFSPSKASLDSNETTVKKLISSESVDHCDCNGKSNSDTIVIHGLPHDTTKELVSDKFGMSGDMPLKKDRHGAVRVDLCRDYRRGQNNGIIAYVSYINADVAESAVAIFDGVEFKGNNIQVSIAKHGANSASSSPSSGHFSDCLSLFSEASNSMRSVSRSRNLFMQSAGSSVFEGGEELQKQLSLRAYQRELAERAMKGENCIIVAPTGSGKTHVVIAIIRQHLDTKAYGDKQKPVIFFVPAADLVDKRRLQFLDCLPNPKVLGIGADKDLNSPLSQLISRYSIIIMTVDILEKAIKGHPYSAIMSCFMDEKFEVGERGLPQIVGLTASIGVGKAKTTGQSGQTVKDILKLCATLDARCICTVKRNVIELSKYINRPDERTEEIRGRTHDPFRDTITEIMKEIEYKIQKSETVKEIEVDCKEFPSLLLPPSDHGSDRFTQWIHKLIRPVASIYRQEIRQFFETCLRHLSWYNSALMINADCRTMDAFSYLVRARSQSGGSKKDKSLISRDLTDDWLNCLFTSKEDNLRAASRDPKNENPKLTALKQIISSYYHPKPDSRGIIFCKSCDLTEALVNWMNDELRQLNPYKLTDNNTTTQQAGLTRHDTVLQCFEAGHKIIVSTFDIEESLDIRTCNVIVRYEHVSHQLARVQCQIHDDCTQAKIGTAEEFHRMWEIRMQKAIETIDDMSADELHEEINRLQRETHEERSAANLVRRINRAPIESPVFGTNYELYCDKCEAFAANSNDIRKIEESHHVIVDKDCHGHIRIRPHPAPKKFPQFEVKAKIYCKTCDSDWGILVIYKQVELPVVKIGSFFLKSSSNSSTKLRCKRWKDVPFQVNNIGIDDLQRIRTNMTT